MKMNKTVHFFTCLKPYVREYKGQLLGKKSGAGSQESQQGGQGQALSDKGTVPWHLNKKEQVHDSSQGQLTYW